MIRRNFIFVLSIFFCFVIFSCLMFVFSFRSFCLFILQVLFCYHNVLCEPSNVTFAWYKNAQGQKMPDDSMFAPLFFSINEHLFLSETIIYSKPNSKP